MKKILLILLFSSLFLFKLSAKEKKQWYSNSFKSFNIWLLENGYDHYLDKDKFIEIQDKSSCNPNVPQVCVDSDGKFIPHDQYKYKKVYENNLNIKTHPDKWGIHFPSNPNRDSLIYYFYKSQFSHLTGDENSYQWKELKVKPSKKPYQFQFNLIEDKFVKKQMKSKGILSYLYYQEGKVLIDEISPKERLGEFVNNETKLRSASMNKSVTSYILGHAICGGYIDSVDSKIDDWPILKDTLFENQKIIDLLNMAAGDQKYVNEFKFNPNSILADNSYEYETNNIKATIYLFFKNTEKSKSIYNYNGFVTQLLLNYTKHKTGDNYKKILNKVFQDKVKNEQSVTFMELNSLEEYGNGHGMVMATRFDYLRLAKAMMDDYQNDTCVGKYLKEIYKRRIPKNYSKNKHEPEFNRTKSYGGQFHMDYPGLENRVIFGFGGYGGKAILIDMENSRIVVLNSQHFNNDKFKYSIKKLLIDPIKKGEKAFK